MNPYLAQANAILTTALATSERPVMHVSQPLPHDPHLRYVLAFLKHNPNHPFVTWYENMQDTIREGHPVYYEGEYCETYDAALRSLRRRMERRQVQLDSAAPTLLYTDIHTFITALP